MRGALLGEPGWIAMAARAFGFIAADMTRGDRLGHSWRAGRLLFPGLASDYACMVKAALALYEATGERPISTRRSPGSTRSTATTPTRTMAAISSPPTMPKAWWCARPRPMTTRRRTRTGSRPHNLVRLAVLTGDDAWREKADRLIEGVLGAAGENLIGHAALLNALDLRLRGAEIVVTGSGARADALAAAALQTAVPRPHRAARADRRCAARRTSGARQDRGGARRRRVRVCRRTLLAAGDEPDALAAAVAAMRAAAMRAQSDLTLRRQVPAPCTSRRAADCRSRARPARSRDRDRARAPRSSRRACRAAWCDSRCARASSISSFGELARRCRCRGTPART